MARQTLAAKDSEGKQGQRQFLGGIGNHVTCGRFMGLREGGREGKECRVQAVPTQKRIWNTAVINQQFSYIFCLVKLEKNFLLISTKILKTKNVHIKLWIFLAS